jgi:hypothetical protein
MIWYALDALTVCIWLESIEFSSKCCNKNPLAWCNFPMLNSYHSHTFYAQTPSFVPFMLALSWVRIQFLWETLHSWANHLHHTPSLSTIFPHLPYIHYISIHHIHLLLKRKACEKGFVPLSCMRAQKYENMPLQRRRGHMCTQCATIDIWNTCRKIKDAAPKKGMPKKEALMVHAQRVGQKLFLEQERSLLHPSPTYESSIPIHHHFTQWLDWACKSLSLGLSLDLTIYAC